MTARRMRRRAVVYTSAGLVLAAAAAAAASFLLHWPVPHQQDAAARANAASLFHLLQREDAAWNTDILKAGIGLQDNYDDIAARKRSLDAAFSRLADAQAAQPGERARLDVLRRIFDDKADAVETFKSHHSILRNSLRYVSTAADEARDILDADTGTDAKTREQLRQTLAAAASQALRYAVVADEDQRARLAAATLSLDEAVARLPESSASKGQMLIVLSHLHTVLHQKPDVDVLLRTILDSPTGKVIEDAAVRGDARP